MKLVIDANIIFAALIKDGLTAELIASPKLDLYCPSFLFEEFEKFKAYLLKKTHRSLEEFMGYLAVLKRNIHTISVLPTEECFQRAKELSPDPKDALYFAIALKLKIGIWTNDKRLRDQTEISILGTSELVEQNYHKSNP